MATELDELLRPTREEAAADNAGRPRLELPPIYRCDDPWCPARPYMVAQATEHRERCTACQEQRTCAYLELLHQEPHLHGRRPEGTG